MPTKPNPNDASPSVEIRVGPRTVVMRQSQRAQYRMSKSINFADFNDPTKQFALFCDLVVCLDQNPKPTYNGEDVALAYAGKEMELSKKVLQAMGTDKAQIEQLEAGEKKSSSTDGPSHASS